MNSDISNYIVIGIVVMLLMVVGVLIAVIMTQRRKTDHRVAMEKLREQQQNQLISAAVRSEENERHRIAEILHDEVGAILSSARLHLFGINESVLNEKDLALHEKGGELLDEVIQKVRTISHNLHSNILKEFGLNEAIRHFIKKITDNASISAQTNLDEKYTQGNEGDDMSIYRMVQELVNNILKYAHATEFLISSVLQDNDLDLVIFHNGEGLTQQQFEELRYQKDGLGLKNIQNRIILLQGTIHFNRGGEGYSINIHVPLKSKKLTNE